MGLSDQLSTSGGSTDEEPRSLAGALSLSAHIDQRATKAEANYVEPGPAPYQCGNCKYILWGGKPSGADLCQLVAGTIYANGACRFFVAKPNYRMEKGDDGNVTPIGVYSTNPPIERQTRLEPKRIPWRVDRWGWGEREE